MPHLHLDLLMDAGDVAHPDTKQVREGWLNSVAVNQGGETPVGPVFVGVGRGVAAA